MSWWGKALGGAFGFMIGGPLGALMGIAFGHSFDRGLGLLALYVDPVFKVLSRNSPLATEFHRGKTTGTQLARHNKRRDIHVLADVCNG